MVIYTYFQVRIMPLPTVQMIAFGLFVRVQFWKTGDTEVAATALLSNAVW